MLSLEIRATNIPKRSEEMRKSNRIDKKPLSSVGVDFSRLSCLKIFGSADFLDIIDKDLIAIARTATALCELHIVSTSSVTTKGVGALIDSSRRTLETFDVTPSMKWNSKKPSLFTASSYYYPNLHYHIAQCPRLRSITLPSSRTCMNLLANPGFAWSGLVQIHIRTLHADLPDDTDFTDARQTLWKLLDQVRSFTSNRGQPKEEQIRLELFVRDWLFEPENSLVHTNSETGSYLPWLIKKRIPVRDLDVQSGLLLDYLNVVPDELFKKRLSDGDLDIQSDYMKKFCYSVSEEDLDEGMKSGFVYL
ncbi:hypothetical protein MMC28_002172 [Mycoblastus sanguinarius]|nr:hypothetical protein [Mycoblastus sanguinarius]